MPIERKLAAIMFTDIAGYTALSAKDSTKASELLTTQRDTLKPIVEKHGGSWMKEMGDGLLLTFDSATSAVECSIAIQDATKDIDDLNLRIGIHEGEVIKQDDDVIGDDVNVASRIEPFSAVGGVAISQKIQQAISSNQEFETKYIGKPKLKGVAQEVKVYCITSHGLPETNISKVSAKLEEESKFNIFALTGGILTAIGVAFWIAVGVFDVSFGGKVEVPSVGILIMENLGKEDEEYWSSGMTADLITKVAGAGLIRVAPLDDILKLDKDLSIEEKAKKLRVKYILTHSFLINDDGFDLWCKLENIENGVALFSNKISEPMDMTTQMVGKLANDIITSLKVETKQNMMEAPTANDEAYEYYLKGKYKYQQRKNKEHTEIARGLLQKGIDLDKYLFEARFFLSDTYWYDGYHEKAYELINNTLVDALSKGDKKAIAQCYNDIGVIKGVEDRTLSLEYLEKAYSIRKEINDLKGQIESLVTLGGHYSNMGEFYLAIKHQNNALALDKKINYAIKWPLTSLGGIYAYLGKYEESENYYNQYKQLILSSPIITEGDRIYLDWGSATYFYRIGRYNQALDLQKSIRDIIYSLNEMPSISSYHIDLGKINFALGNLAAANEDFQIAYNYYKELKNTAINNQDELQALSFLVVIKIKLNQLDYSDNLNRLEELIQLSKNSNGIIIESKRMELILWNYYNILKELSLNTKAKEYLSLVYSRIIAKSNNLNSNDANIFLSKNNVNRQIVEEWEKVK